MWLVVAMGNHSAKQHAQRGGTLIIFVLILVIAGTTALLSTLDGSEVKIERNKKTAAALAEAKAALIGDAISQSIDAAGYLRMPDLGFGPLVTTISEGSFAPNFSGNNKDFTVIGKFPWKSYGLQPLHDGYEECLWYIVSGRFKVTPKTDTLNWDTQGQIDVIDASGNIIAANLAALIAASGPPLGTQSHMLADSTYSQCGGNYDARNYLDTYDLENSIAGVLNYFTGSVNNRVSLNKNNKKFVLANNDHYNDKFLFVTLDEIFRPIIRRSDFKNQITALFDDPDFKSHLLSIDVEGNKGTDEIDCDVIDKTTKKPLNTFCQNWEEMLLLTQLPTPSTITIDGTSTMTACTRVLIFGGQKTGAQARISIANKNDPANYLEDANLTAFNTPSSDFDGISVFDAANASADVLRCL